MALNNQRGPAVRRHRNGWSLVPFCAMMTGILHRNATMDLAQVRRRNLQQPFGRSKMRNRWNVATILIVVAGGLSEYAAATAQAQTKAAASGKKPNILV